MLTSSPVSMTAMLIRCLGCGHFRTDPSYLPELRDYLDTLLQTRERIRAAQDLDDWARAEATPSDEEITRLRQLIRRAEHDLSQLAKRSSAPAESDAPAKPRYSVPASASWNSNCSTCAKNSKNEPTISAPHEQPTVTSWPLPTGNPPRRHSALHLSHKSPGNKRSLTWDNDKHMADARFAPRKKL